ncbi:MAG: sporulation integral membrane protein YtvI [Defluviitaleaceae bacterium]|nr:sporulation integral membrane protein YtvI [Defluviitaleaceae bacterium]
MLVWLRQENIKPYARLLARIILTAAAVLLLLLFVPLILGFFLPFILAFFVASLANPLIGLINRKLKIPRGVMSIVMVSIPLLLLAGLLGWVIYLLVMQIIALAQNIEIIVYTLDNVVTVITTSFYWISSYLPTDTEQMLTGILDGFWLWLQDSGTTFADTMLTQAATATGRIGIGVVSVVIFILASYFIMADYPRIIETIKSISHKSIHSQYSTIRNATLSAVGGYLRAQAIMAFVTFVVSLIALLVIQHEFALLVAVLLGFVDFLPLVGTSILLVPWAIILFITGDIFLAVYLLALSSVAFLLRRVIEPKIVGTQMGLPPLSALVSIYIGLQLMGFAGLILGPIIAMVLVSLYKAGIFAGWIADITAVVEQIRNRQKES